MATSNNNAGMSRGPVPVTEVNDSMRAAAGSDCPGAWADMVADKVQRSTAVADSE